VVFDVVYAVEFLCLSVAELMVLERMLQFLMSYTKKSPNFLGVTFWTVVAFVVVGNVVGLAANIAAAVYYSGTSAAFGAASVSLWANKTAEGMSYRSEGISLAQEAAVIQSVQHFAEVCVLLLIIIAFVATGISCLRRINWTLNEAITDQRGTAASMGRSLRFRIFCTTGTVFMAFLLRAVFSTMTALANQLQDSDKSCHTGPEGLCDPCYNAYTNMQRWILRTPEFQLTVVLISSPLALIVALWGMTPRHTMKQLYLIPLNSA
jgi:hypothetical protein